MYGVEWGPSGFESRVYAATKIEALREAWHFYEHPFLGRRTEEEWDLVGQQPPEPVAMLWLHFVSFSLDELAYGMANTLIVRLEEDETHPPDWFDPLRENRSLLLQSARGLLHDVTIGMCDSLVTLSRGFGFDLRDAEAPLADRPAVWPTFEICAKAWDERLAIWALEIRNETQRKRDHGFDLDFLDRYNRALRRGHAARILFLTAFLHDAKAVGWPPMPRRFERIEFRSIAAEARALMRKTNVDAMGIDYVLPVDVEIGRAHRLARSALCEEDPLLLDVLDDRLPSSREVALTWRAAEHPRRRRRILDID